MITLSSSSNFIRDPLQDRVQLVTKPNKHLDIALLGIPWDWSTAGRPGARFAPASIREYLRRLSAGIPSSRSAFSCRIEDLGDVDVAPGDYMVTAKKASQAVREAFKRRLAVFLGGDHSITKWIVEALLEEYDSVGLVVLDAHFDLRSVREGFTSGSWLYELLRGDSGEKIKAVIIGVQDFMNPSYMTRKALELGVNFVTRRELIEGIERALEVIDRIKEYSPETYYLSIDMDHIAEAYAPGVNVVNPLGLTPWESLKIVEYVAHEFKPKGFDVVEVSPPYDVGGRTVHLASHIIIHTIYAIMGECSE